LSGFRISSRAARILRAEGVSAEPKLEWDRTAIRGSKPKSRTVRLVTNVEVFDAGRNDTRMVRSNVMIAEFRGFETRCLYGWCGHRYLRQDGKWMIAVRQLNLIDCDQCIRNPSIVL